MSSRPLSFLQQRLQLPKEGRAGSFGMPRATSVRADKAPANGEVKRGASAFTGSIVAA